MSQTLRKTLSGKVYDPVVLCMLGAMILAVTTSIILRTMVARVGPNAAHADASYDSPDPPARTPDPAHPAAPAHPTLARP